MSESRALAPAQEADYEAIESAVMETARGRWFLGEYARRNRNADTETLLDAIGRIENMVQQNREAQEMDRLRFDLMEMAKAISRTKSEIAAMRPQGGETNELNVASEALDAIVRTTERATSDILEAAEHVQEAAWTLREEGANEKMCDELDRRATDIYTACSFQDLTAQRTSRIVNTLRYLEGRIEAMIEIWGAPEEAEHQRRQQDLNESLDVFNGLSQDAIDDVIVEEGGAAARAEPEQAAEAYFFDVDGPADPQVVEHLVNLKIDTATLAVAPKAEIEEIAWAEAPPVEAEDDAEEAVLGDEAAQATLSDEELPEAEFAGEEEAAADADDALFEEEPEDDQSDALAELDALDVQEKLRRFT
jgi:chemotaxis regulatin CheY-phosphate phosphatase CheZ